MSAAWATCSSRVSLPRVWVEWRRLMLAVWVTGTLWRLGRLPPDPPRAERRWLRPRSASSPGWSTVARSGPIPAVTQVISSRAPADAALIVAASSSSSTPPRPGPAIHSCPRRAWCSAVIAGVAGLISLVSYAAERTTNRPGAVAAVAARDHGRRLRARAGHRPDVTNRTTCWVLLVVLVLGALRYPAPGRHGRLGPWSSAYIAPDGPAAGRRRRRCCGRRPGCAARAGVILPQTIPWLPVRAAPHRHPQPARRGAGQRAGPAAGDCRRGRSPRDQPRGRGRHRVTSRRSARLRRRRPAVLRDGSWFRDRHPEHRHPPPPRHGPPGRPARWRPPPTHRTMVTDRSTDDPAEEADLVACGLEAVVASPSTPSAPRRRCGRGVRERLVSTAQFECLELLVAQAGVAMRNGQLVAEHGPCGTSWSTGLPRRPHRSQPARFLQRLEGRSRGPPPRTSRPRCCSSTSTASSRSTTASATTPATSCSSPWPQRAWSGRSAPTTSWGRLGGDEFVRAARPVRTADEATVVAERPPSPPLNEPFVVAEPRGGISCSVGIAIARGLHQSAELVRRADQAMYRARPGGRALGALPGRHDTASVTASQLEADLRTALQRDQLRLVTSPSTGPTTSRSWRSRPSGWDHPPHGAIPPSTLIPMAEESGLIVVGSSACARPPARTPSGVRQLHRWLVAARRQRVPSQLNHPGFSADLDRILGETRCRPRPLLLEVTENVVALGSELVDLLSALRARGVRASPSTTSARVRRRCAISVRRSPRRPEIDKVFVDGLAGEVPHRAIALGHRPGPRLGLGSSPRASGSEPAPVAPGDARRPHPGATCCTADRPGPDLPCCWAGCPPSMRARGRRAHEPDPRA